MSDRSIAGRVVEESLISDIRDAGPFVQAFERARCGVVLPIVAQALVRRSDLTRNETLDTKTTEGYRCFHTEESAGPLVDNQIARCEALPETVHG